MEEAEVAGLGLTATDSGPTPVVLIRARDCVVPIFVTSQQADSIGLALNDEPFERPLTHDLTMRLLDAADMSVDRVRIDDIDDNTFYAKIDVELADGSKQVFNARPSDSIALTLRTECPISVSEDVLKETGKDASDIQYEVTGDDSTQPD